VLSLRLVLCLNCKYGPPGKTILKSVSLTNGKPYPQNLQTALEVESIVRQHNAVPATVALLDGHVYVGLDHAMLETLASAKVRACVRARICVCVCVCVRVCVCVCVCFLTLSKNVRKTSRRDMAAVIASRAIGATTVSGTMIAAHASGIPLFVTGGASV
jgi:pseudouridine-5'-phosphate glycosidase